MQRRIDGVKQGARRRWKALLAVAAALGALGAFSITALAVHDEEFQLDGDVFAATQTHVPAGSTQTVDWDSIFNSSGVAKSPLPTGFSGAGFAPDFRTNANGSFNTSDPTTFATGSKDTLPISGWQCNQDNNVNSKTDVMNSYAVEFDSGGDDVMYFALERNANTGDGNVGFWFLQDDVNCNSQGTTGTFTGGHRDGDLLIVSEFSNGGTVSSIKAYRWNGGANGALGTTEVASGGDCTTNTGNDTACATVNKATMSGIPWLTANKQDGVGHSLRVAEFFEGGINLSALNLGDKCFNVFIGDTRSSTSLTATIFDYARGKTGTCSSTTVTTPKDGSDAVIPAGGLNIPGDPNDATLTVHDDATVTVDGVDTFSGTLSFHLCGPFAAGSATLCDTGGVAVSSQTITAQGDYQSSDATVTSAGRYCWRADFSGDATTGVPPSSDSRASECFVVNPRQPAIVTQASTGPVDFGNPISDTATLSNTAHKPGTGGPAGSNGSINPTSLGGDATGTITFRAFGPDSCSTVAFTSTPQAVTGNGDYQASFTPTSPGQYIWVASYTGDLPNTLGVSEGTCAGAPDAEKVTVRQIPTTIETSPRAYPNDSATVTSTVAGDSLPSGGTIQFRLFDSQATCAAGADAQTVGQDGLLYKESDTSVGGAHSDSATTSNTTVAVSTSATVYWRVTYATGDSAHTGRQSACVENTSMTFTIEAGPGTLFP